MGDTHGAGLQLGNVWSRLLVCAERIAAPI